MRRLQALLIVLLLLLPACSSPPAPPKAPPGDTALRDEPPPAKPPTPGAIVATINAQVPPRVEPPWIQSAAFATPDRGWVILSDNTALKTIDGGVTWQRADLPPAAQVNFTSERLGFAGTSADTYRSMDGGNTWHKVDTTGWPVPWAQFIDEQHGWAQTDRSVLHGTSDGGKSWHQLAYPCPTDGRSVYSFINAQTGWMLCGFQEGSGFMSKRLFRTADGGKRWTMLGEALAGPPGRPEEGAAWPGGLNYGDYIGTLDFVDAQHGWYLGIRYGDFAATEDGGRTWQSLPPRAVRGGSVRFLNPHDGYRMGYSTAEQGSVLSVTHDGGVTWTQVYPHRTPRPVAYLDAQTHVGLLDNALYRSTDGGTDWAALGKLPDGEQFRSVQYASVNSAWLLTAKGDDHRLYRSEDGGAQWHLVNDSPSLKPLSTPVAVDQNSAILWDSYNGLLSVVDAASGWIARDFLLYATADGGHSWQVAPMKPEQKAQGVALTPDGRVWALIVDISNEDRPEGMLLASADHGKTWTRYTLGDFDQSNSVYRCGPASICVRSSGSGDHIVSHDGGLTWAYGKGHG